MGRVGKMSRTMRILRMVRLLRIARLHRILKLFTFRIQSERVVILADIAKILIFIIAAAHVMACFWYGIGSKAPDSWMAENEVYNLQLAHRYLISLHWSLCQFQGGMDEFRAANLKERCYNVCMNLLAFMMAAICVSDLTSSMTRLHILSSHQSRQLAVLRRYLMQNGISDKLSLRVQRNALHAISEQQRLMAEHHVELLSAVSEPLRVELHFEMYSPVLEVHPFFFEYIKECPQVMCRVCHQAMSTLLVSNGDVIFSVGEIPDNPKMYVVCNGMMEYVPGSGEVTEVDSEKWLSEGALWTHWMHRGVLRAMSDGRLCLVDAKTFVHIVLTFSHLDFDPKEYAEDYVDRLNEAQTQGTLVSDLPLGTEGQFMRSKIHRKAHVDLRLTMEAFVGKNTMMDMKNRSSRRHKSVLFEDGSHSGRRSEVRKRSVFFEDSKGDDKKADDNSWMSIVHVNSSMGKADSNESEEATQEQSPP